MKMSQLKMVIREVVREEIQLGLKEVIGAVKKQPVQKQVQKSKPPKNQNFSKNPILNEMLNETAQDEWETMGGTKFTSERMNELVGKNYGDMMNDDSDNKNGNLVVEMGVNPNDAPDFLKKDYRAVMKAIDKKQGKK